MREPEEVVHGEGTGNQTGVHKVCNFPTTSDYKFRVSTDEGDSPKLSDK